MPWFSDSPPEQPDSNRSPGVREGTEPLVVEGAFSSDGVRWAPVARFVHVAEAGYFADELTARLEAPVVVRSEQSFDALQHHWQTRFLLLVPQSVRDRAAQMLGSLNDNEASPADDPDDQWPGGQDELAASEDAFDPHATAAERGAQDVGRIPWGPIVATLTAGSAVLFGWRWMHEPAKPPRPAQGEAGLLDAMSQSSKPWVQPIGEGPGRRELVIDRRRGVAILTEDFDGDGVPEREMLVPLDP